MLALGQHQIVEKLSPMLWVKSLDSFQLKDGFLIDYQVECIRLDEVFVRNGDGGFDGRDLELRSKRRLINALIKKPPQFMMDLKRCLHDVVRDCSELFLLQGDNWKRKANGHGSLQNFR